MKNCLLVLIVLLVSLSGFAQDKTLKRSRQRQVNPNTNPNRLDTNQDKDDRTVIDNRPRPPISDYKIVSVDNDTTYVDTTLGIHKDYKFNYLRKDDFGLLPFSNVGQPYTSLERSFNEVNLMPKFGARATHFAFLDVDDIHYYHVPTPWTRLYFKTTFKQGQNLDAFFTSNLSPQFNFSIAYKGLHSLGKYQHILTSQGSFRTTFNYRTKNDRYEVKAHFIAQDLSTEENGGLTNLSDGQFKSKSNEFSDRSVLDVKFQDAEDLLLAKRFYVKHHYKLIKGNDSTANNQVRLGHILNFTDQEYHYSQDDTVPYFGQTFKNSSLRDKTQFQDVSNTLFAQYQNNILGKFLFKVSNSNYNYGYNRKLNLDSEVIPNRLKGNVYAAGASYKKNISGFELYGDAMLNVAGDFDGNYIKAHAAYALDSLNRVEVGLTTNSHQPNYNFLLYQSDYKNYNWRNKFDNVQKQTLNFRLRSKKIADIEADFTQIHNYAYFGLKENENPNSRADTLVAPFQYDGDISYLKIKAKRKFKYWRVSLDNTLMYQNVLKGEDVFRVPSFVTRNSLYYSDYWFHKALYLQTGFTFNYFDSFKADAYDPVLAEFYVQNNQELKGFYRVDFFFNTKIQQTRIFLKLENLTTLFQGNGNYAAPFNPYRDFVIRFGLIWDFFL